MLCQPPQMGVLALTLLSLALRLAAITIVAVVCANGITPIGLPRIAGRACSSTPAKKPSKSKYRRSTALGFFIYILINYDFRNANKKEQAVNDFLLCDGNHALFLRVMV